MTALSSSYVLGANEKIRVAVVGLGGKGPNLLRAFNRLGNVRIAALCDVDRGRLGRAARKFEKSNGPVDQVVDYRRLLDRSDIDAVISRKKSDLNCEIEQGFCSSRLPILANIAHRTGDSVSIEQLEAKTQNNPYLHDAVKRYVSQGKQLGFDFKKEPWVFNSNLLYDTKGGKFSGPESKVNEANALLQRDGYRAPFALSEEV